MLTTLGEVERFLRQHLESATVHRPNPLIPDVINVEFVNEKGARVGCRVNLILPCSTDDAQESVRELEKKARPLRGGVG